MRGQHTLAVGVDLLGEVGDSSLLRGRGGREGKGVKAARLVVNRAIFQCSTCCQSPRNMDAAGQHAEPPGIIKRDSDQPVIRRNRGIKKLEDAMLGGFYCGDIPRQAKQCSA